MSRIIITNESTLPDTMALTLVQEVIKLGRVSSESYCFVSTFQQGHRVYANRTKTGTDTFHISDGEKK